MPLRVVQFWISNFFEKRTCAEDRAKIIKDYVSLRPTTQVIVNRQMLASNPFAPKIIRNTIKGTLSALKGFRPGKIEIKIDEQG